MRAHVTAPLADRGSCGHLKNLHLPRLEVTHASSCWPKPGDRCKLIRSCCQDAMIGRSWGQSRKILKNYCSMKWQRMKKYDQRCVGISKEQHNGNFTDPSSLNKKRRRDQDNRQNIVLWWQPLITLLYFSLKILVVLKEWTSKLWHHQSIVVSLLLLLSMLITMYYVEGAHQ